MDQRHYKFYAYYRNDALVASKTVLCRQDELQRQAMIALEETPEAQRVLVWRDARQVFRLRRPSTSH